MSILKTTEQSEASTICKKIVTFTSYHNTTCFTKITVFIVFFACRLLVSFLVSKFTIKSLSINDVIQQQQQLAALERHARARMYAPFALALEAVLARLWRQQSASDARQAVGGGMVQVDVT